MRRSRTAAARCAVPVLAFALLGACSSTSTLPPPPSTAISLVPGDTLPLWAVQSEGVRPIRLLIGDTLRLDFTDPDARPPGRPRGGWRTESDNPTIATVTPDGLITAKAPGRANITVTGPGPRARRSYPVQVLTARQATNLMAVEVCPNTAGAFLTREPMPPSVAPIHEYHDCQRLIKKRVYVALVGIFAHHNTADYGSWQQWQGGRLAAIIMNYGAKTPESTPYPTLGIAYGVNCLVLKAESETLWRAAVVSLGNPTSQCDEAQTWASLPLTAKHLEVRRQEGVDMNGDRLAPPVARWDWNPRDSLNYMGVRCDARTWCEIGDSGFVRSDPRLLRELSGPPSPPNPGAEVLKGYYDQQHLADATGANPSTVIGTIWPGDAGKKRDGMKDKSKEHEVARLEFLETGPSTSQDYRRYLRNYKKQETGPYPRMTRVNYTLKRQYGTPAGKEYKGKFAGKSLTDVGVLMTKHSGILHKGPPVVRWRWDALDERTWTYCDPDGCCENVEVLLK